MITRKPWAFGRGITSRDYLNGSQSFDALVQELSDAMDITKASNVRFLMESTSGKNTGYDPLIKRLKCMRPSWRIPLDRPLLDKFFNGKMGIRAQYYESPYHGYFMNRRLLSKIQHRLVEIALALDRSVDARLLHLSLTAASAKVWISEKDLTGMKIIRASDLTLVEDEIQNDWLDLARQVKQGEVGTEHYQLYCAAINGVRAPIADQLEVKGAWITQADRCEYVTPDKRDRDCQLFMFGFT